MKEAVKKGTLKTTTLAKIIAEAKKAKKEELVRAAAPKKAKRGIQFGRLSHLKNVELDPDWWKPMTSDQVDTFLDGR